mgnify:CR=1 FL=1
MRNRNLINKLKTRYTKIPNKIFQLGLSPISICIYCLLCSYSEEFKPTLGNISKAIGIHRNTVCRAMKELCVMGVIRKTKQGQVFRSGNSQSPESNSYQSEYEFTNPNAWVAKIVSQPSSPWSVKTSGNVETHEE